MKVFDFTSSEDRTSQPVVVRGSSQGLCFYNRFGKRLVDLVLAVVLLPVFLPVIAVIWALTRLDGGPGFYTQKRVGLNGHVFDCWKIRTMVMNSEQVLRDLCDRDPEVAREWSENQKLAKDPRVTKVGDFLRATSLDELPQIWNVLRGDMSFIGPRPFMTSQEHMYRAAGGEAYFKMRPGITGAWQVDGRGVTTFRARVTYDEAYFVGLSFREDLRLVGKTILVLLKRTGH